MHTDKADSESIKEIVNQVAIQAATAVMLHSQTQRQDFSQLEHQTSGKTRHKRMEGWSWKSQYLNGTHQIGMSKVKLFN